eukprot:scaffold3181_cov389-Prasinococcus_capsulatus_cf.AAC.20
MAAERDCVWQKLRWGLLQDLAGATEKIGVLSVSAIDAYLLATVQLVFALGIYELFISEIDPESIEVANKMSFLNLGGSRKPRWLQISSLDDLKAKLVRPGHAHWGQRIVSIPMSMRQLASVNLSATCWLPRGAGQEELEVHRPTDLLVLSLSAAVASAALYFSGLVGNDAGKKSDGEKDDSPKK